jgi:2,3-bisphosphoglycerate-independent phosphoglycerate mutase
MANDSRTTRHLLEALGFEYGKYDHDSLVRAALRELEERRRHDFRAGRIHDVDPAGLFRTGRYNEGVSS